MNRNAVTWAAAFGTVLLLAGCEDKQQPTPKTPQPTATTPAPNPTPTQPPAKPIEKSAPANTGPALSNIPWLPRAG